MKDRKFADIGNTVSHQYNGGLFSISKWANLVTVHSIPGQGILQGLESKFATSSNRAVVLLAEMSSQGNLIGAPYIEATMKMAVNDHEFVAGIVCQHNDVVSSPGLVQFTPGVKIEEKCDELGQQYNSPVHVVKDNGADTT